MANDLFQKDSVLPDTPKIGSIIEMFLFQLPQIAA